MSFQLILWEFPNLAVSNLVVRNFCAEAFFCALFCAPNLPESRGERILFHGQPNLSPIFREISCAHFSWKLKDENRRKNFAIFSPHFSPMSAKKFARISLSGLFGIIFCALLCSFSLLCRPAFALICALLRLLHSFLRPTAFRTTACGICGLLSILVNFCHFSTI